jgi:ClpP class serine protease
MLDPFQPEKPEDVARLEALQRDVHAMFIDLVKSRRGASLKESPDLFTGAFWSGAKAVELGLADRVGDLRSLMRERYGEGVRFKSIQTERNAWRRRLGLAGSDRFAGALVDRLVSAAEERLLWNRFGL